MWGRWRGKPAYLKRAVCGEAEAFQMEALWHGEDEEEEEKKKKSVSVFCENGVLTKLRRTCESPNSCQDISVVHVIGLFGLTAHCFRVSAFHLHFFFPHI